MKTILMPTDFSATSRNAIDYAAEIAKLTTSKLILFHVYQVPIITSETTILTPTLEELEKSCKKGLNMIKNNLVERFGEKFEIECKCKCGFVVEEINQFAEDHAVDLIVMGIHGKDYITEKIIGSVTTSLLQKSKYPVLAIDQLVKYRSIKRIVLANDYHELPSPTVVNKLKEFLSFFNAHLYVLNIIKELESVPSILEVTEGIKLRHHFNGVGCSFHKTENDDVIDGINEFVFDNKVDMVVMLPHKHSWFSKLFKESHTKKMAFHSYVPLLALHA